MDQGMGKTLLRPTRPLTSLGSYLIADNSLQKRKWK